MPTDAHRAGVQAQAAERALKQADGSTNMPAWSLKDAVASRQQKSVCSDAVSFAVYRWLVAATAMF